MSKFKAKLIGKRIVLKRLKPNLATANSVFQAVKANHQHLEPWFPWVKHNKTLEDSLKFLFDLEEKYKNGTKVDYGVYLDNQYIGNVGIFNIDKKNKSAEIGYWLAQDFTRQGYTTEAVSVLEKEFFSQVKLNRIQIRCDERNIPSAGVAKKCNYFLEGRLREESYSAYFKDYKNTLIFSKLQSEFKKKKGN